MKQIVYYLEVTAENCIVTAEINGLPFYNLNAKFKSYFASPLNIGLIRNSNKITINLLPIIGENIALDPNKSCKVEIKLKEYENGDISGPDTGKVLHQQSLSTFATIPIVFNNESSIDFSTFFDSLIAVNSEEDEKELKDFTNYIVQSALVKNVNVLKKEFSFKLTQYGKAYYIDEAQYQAYGYDFLENYILKYLPEDYNLQISTIIYKDYCDKKIWHCFLWNKEELLYTAEDEEENVHFIPVYIAKMNGKFQIVR
jgi:hypothetical protein